MEMPNSILARIATVHAFTFNHATAPHSGKPIMSEMHPLAFRPNDFNEAKALVDAAQGNDALSPSVPMTAVMLEASDGGSDNDVRNMMRTMASQVSAMQTQIANLNTIIKAGMDQRVQMTENPILPGLHSQTSGDIELPEGQVFRPFRIAFGPTSA